MVGGPIAGPLLGLDGVLGLHGWQWMYLCEGVPAVLAGFVVLRFMTDSPQDARWLTQALLHPTVWWLAFVAFAFQTGSYGLQLWTPLIVKEWSGLSDLGVGFVSAIPYIGASIGMVLIDASSDRTGERFMYIAVPSASAAGLALINTTGSFGGFVGPYAVGLAKDLTDSYAAGLILLSVLLVLGAAAVLRLRDREKLQPLVVGEPSR